MTVPLLANDHETSSQSIQNAEGDDPTGAFTSTTQRNRKMIVAGCGIEFIVIGILILVFFIGFIENDYKNKCFYNPNLDDHDINNTKNNSTSNSNQWFESHVELKHFDTNCYYKVVNMFRDYPCNCRQYIHTSDNDNIDNDHDSDACSPEMVELMFLNFEDLQNIYFVGDANEEYYFTKEMLSNLKYLQIWNMENAPINHIWSSEGTSKLNNLEIFRWVSTRSYTGTNTSIPFKGFAKLDKMKAIDISGAANLANEEIPDDICNLKQMRLFDINYAPYVRYIPYDCIASNWKELRFMKFETFPHISYITPDIWNLPNLQTVMLTNNAFTISGKSFDFDTFDGFSNSLMKIWLASTTGVCNNGSVIINNTEYQGFGYLSKYLNSSSNSNSIGFSMDDVDNDDSRLLEFIQTFDPCAATCLAVSISCSADSWQNGVCSGECDREECDYDGGDCNQLCDCDYGKWFNNKCDIECNTTQCHWDFDQCIPTPAGNETCNLMNITVTQSIYSHYSYNNTDNIAITIPCYESWIDDTWCDGSCNVESCDYDGGWCNGCSTDGQCGYIWTALSTIPPDEGSVYGSDLFTQKRVCDYKDLVAYFFDEWDEADNCSDIFNVIDLNDNGFLGYYEILQYFAFHLGLTTYSHWQDKALQLDCSECLDNSSYYYW